MNAAINEILVKLVTGVLAILSAFLIALVKKGIDWVSNKIKLIKDDNARASVSDVVERVSLIVENTVTSIEQTLGDEIRKSLKEKDGKYTREDLLNLKNIAVTKVKDQLTDSTVEILNTVCKDLDSFIEILIEVSVRKLKDSGDSNIPNSMILKG